MDEQILYRLSGFPRSHWEQLVLPMLAKLSDNEIEQLRRVLAIRQGTYLPPGAEAEEIYANRDIWTYVVIVAAIQRIQGEAEIPGDGRIWLEGDRACVDELEMCRHSLGFVHELLNRAGLVQSEQLTCEEEAADELDDRTQSDKETGNESGATEGDAPVSLLLQRLRVLVEQGEIEIGSRGAALHVVSDGVLVDRRKAFRLLSEDWKELESSVARELPRRKYYPRSAPPGTFIEGYIAPFDAFEGVVPEYPEVDDLEECDA